MLSTQCTTECLDITRRTRRSDQGTEVIKKPKLVDDYNSHMGGVDTSDQLIRYYGYPHRSIKWWKRVFFHLLDLSILNANILYNQTANNNMSQLDFCVAVVSSLLTGHSPRAVNRHYAPTTELPMRLSERPFIERIPSETAHGGRPRCKLCTSRGKNRSQTKYRCKICKTPLHCEPCFEIYHTVLHYGRTSSSS